MHLGFPQKLPRTAHKTHFPIPRLLFIRVTEACNASCFMCNFSGNQTPHLFTVKDAHQLVNELAGSSIRHVRLTGGEPLLLDEVAQIVSIFKNAGLAVSIITNGLLLERRWSDLAVARLDQIIVSLDSPRPEVHDKLRNTEGLFQKALGGIIHIRNETPSTLIRVNTVVCEHNLESLPDMFVLLHELGVKQWSLIPRKPLPKRLSETFEYTVLSVRERLRDHYKQLDEPYLMGNSLDMFGRNVKVLRHLVEQGRTETPQPQCEVVEWVRFLDPKTQRVFPCNCVPHRGKEAEKFGESWSRNSWREYALESSRNWLRHNGPSHCTGCEPLNVALGEGCIDLNEDLFGF
jgi:cytosylglucuronate decarboxylase